MKPNIYDFIAIGLGPFNLSLACMTSTIENVEGLFLEQKKEFDWHPGMMLENATMQTPFLSDLVTLADPTHPLSFLNYVKKQGRLYSFYIRENFFLMRQEYNQYCQWACQQLNNIRFNTRVDKITYDSKLDCYLIESTNINQNKQSIFRAKKLVLGVGPTPYIPDACLPLSNKVIHSKSYLEQKSHLTNSHSITVIGSGQSAAEIFYDLLQEIDHYQYELNWLTRSPRFFPLEYSKLTLEMTSPEYVDYFHQLPANKRDDLITKQKHLYKGINASLINDIYDLLYIKRLNGPINVKLITNAELTDCEYLSETNGFAIKFNQREQKMQFDLYCQQLVLATGFQYRLPNFIQPIIDRIEWDNKGRFNVKRNYSIDKNKQTIFVQNAELHTHGFVTPDLGMACYRNTQLIKEITGKEHYKIERRIAFQNFDVSHLAQEPIAELEVCN